MSDFFKTTIGDAELYFGDAIEILPTLGECSDVIVSDPPYVLTYGGPDGSMGGCLSPENYDNKGGLVECNIDWPDFMPLLYNALRGNAHCWTMCNNRHVQGMLNAAEKAGFRFHNLAVWDKGTATPNRWLMKNCEFIGFFYKGKAKFVNDCGAKQLIYVPNEDYGGHPTVKPVGLCENYIVQSSMPQQTVLDPFMGVGSTGIAALKSGRKFIGIEISDKWYKAAVKRMIDFYEQPRQLGMF